MAESVWRSIRDRDNINVRSLHLPSDTGGGVLVRYHDGTVWILLDASLSATERRAVLAHELVHLERGTCRFEGSPASWDAVVAKEEHMVDRAVAERLVPLEELRDFAAARAEVEPVTAYDVAEAFGVPVWVAREACARAV